MVIRRNTFNLFLESLSNVFLVVGFSICGTVKASPLLCRFPFRYLSRLMQSQQAMQALTFDGLLKKFKHLAFS